MFRDILDLSELSTNPELEEIVQRVLRDPGLSDFVEALHKIIGDNEDNDDNH